MKEEAALGNEPLRYPASTSGLMGVLQGQELPLPSQHYPRALRKAVVLSVFPSGFITKLPISTCQMLLAEANRHEHQHWQWSFFRKIWPLFSYQPKAKRLSNSRSSCSSPWPRHMFSDLPLSSSASYSAIPFCLPYLLLHDEALHVLPALFESRWPLTATLLLPPCHQPVHPPTPPAPLLFAASAWPWYVFTPCPAPSAFLMVLPLVLYFHPPCLFGQLCCTSMPSYCAVPNTVSPRTVPLLLCAPWVSLQASKSHCVILCLTCTATPHSRV